MLLLKGGVLFYAEQCMLRMLDLLNDVGYNSIQGGPISTELFLNHFQIKLILVDAANHVFKTQPQSQEKTVWSTSFKSVWKMS